MIDTHNAQGKPFHQVTMALISVFVSSPDTHSERRFDSDLTIGQLKVSLLSLSLQPKNDGDARSFSS